MTESKEWVTIKIPEETRDKAKEDSRTYGEVMEDGLRSDNTTTTEVVDAQEVINTIATTADETGRVDDDSIAREVVQQLDYAQLANAVAKELEGRMR